MPLASASSSSPSSSMRTGGGRCTESGLLEFSTERRKPMRLALAQINSVVGDIDGNAAKIVDWLDQARAAEADVVLFPELCVTGYPAEDLLLRPGFVRAAARAVDELARSVHGITALVGSPQLDADLYNACFVLAHGEIRGVYRKWYLPNYGVFDEDRYFAAGRELLVLHFGDVLVGPTVCEDI